MTLDSMSNSSQRVARTAAAALLGTVIAGSIVTMSRTVKSVTNNTAGCRRNSRRVVRLRHTSAWPAHATVTHGSQSVYEHREPVRLPTPPIQCPRVGHVQEEGVKDEVGQPDAVQINAKRDHHVAGDRETGSSAASARA